ncbi:hypothetical protein GTA08_BOTSDO00848 [Botryosphaeria dothidea]|uniref:Uncharacterized protein n=1 Tax=Botryosphaeria dothidea TaxID=55169 RepID=A0A8H4J6R2_9PEZI|nr:hypothetical protein GTA08_BOTSDO00848 [Botryosphaeria dothidea]
MNRNHASHLAFHHARRAAAAAADNAAELDINVLIPVEKDVASGPSKTLLERDASPVLAARSESTSKSCSSSKDSDTCQKPTDSSTAIILAAIVPIAIAIIVLVFLHRRHMKKQALEDLNDKHKSLDFGLDVPSKGAQGGKAPEMSVVDAEKEIRKGGRGLSMDMESSPYLMPGGVQDSRESFHSMSRISDNHDPYRPVTFVKDDTMSLRSASKFNDGMSTYSKSSVGTDRMGLLKNAQRMSRSSPLSPEDRTIPEIQFPEPSHVRPPPSPSNISPVSPDDATPDLTRDAINGSEKRRSLNADSKRTSVQEPTLPQISEHGDVSAQATPRSKPNPLRLESMAASVHNPQTDSIMSKSSDYGDGFKITPPSPGKAGNRMSIDVVNRPSTPPQGLGIQAPKPNRISMSLRPLPTDDPTENPEERANRIRSFYKEYFDDSKPEPAGRYAEDQEDYGQEYMEGAIFDPDKGHFVVGGQPFAEPITRRAMTPPPRAPPRFRGHGPPGGSIGGGRPMTPGSMRSGTPLSMPRGNSAMSFRSGPPKKPLPPPSTLNSLPTPAALKEDSHIFNPIDFAPPPTFREMQSGRRPDSPMGVERPYSPSVRPHTPLATAFDELAVIPSPHALRKSGTFTSLDFMAPPRFKGVDAGSDAASIRSGGSGISAAQLHAVRAGAYRVSRVPKEMVGTKDDLMTSLKPTWDLRAGGAGPQQVRPGM